MKSTKMTISFRYVTLFVAWSRKVHLTKPVKLAIFGFSPFLTIAPGVSISKTRFTDDGVPSGHPPVLQTPSRLPTLPLYLKDPIPNLDPCRKPPPLRLAPRRKPFAPAPSPSRHCPHLPRRKTLCPSCRTSHRRNDPRSVPSNTGLGGFGK